MSSPDDQVDGGRYLFPVAREGNSMLDIITIVSSGKGCLVCSRIVVMNRRACIHRRRQCFPPRTSTMMRSAHRSD
jgi:hypothetical protein